MTFRLGEWIVQEDANLLIRADAQIRVEHRIMAVLMELVAAGGRVVSKDELLEKVWNGTIVSDHSVANAVSDLRRALGDDTRQPQYIQTVPKRGYRLLVAAEDAAEAGPAGAARGRANGVGIRNISLAVVAVLVVAASVWLWLRPDTSPRLFLADIQNATGETRWDVSAETSAEFMAVALAGGDYRLVRWRESVLDEGSYDSLAQEMQLSSRDWILAGQIVLDGNEAMLILQLLEWTDQSLIWAQAYPLEDKRQELLANVILEDIKEPLGITDHANAVGTADSGIFESYWRARYLWNLREHETILEARRLLTDVVARAPDFAPGHAALADIYAHKTAEDLGLDRAESYDISERHLQRAVAIDPNLSDAGVTRAYLSFFRDADIDAAMFQINEAINRRPSNALAWQTKAMIASAAGRANESFDAIRHARELDPLSASMLWDEIWFLYVGERYEDAQMAIEKARQTTAPVNVYEALVYLALGDDAAALEHWLTRAGRRGLTNESAKEIEQISQRDGARAALEALAEHGLSSDEYSDHPVPLALLLVTLQREEAAITALLSDESQEKGWWWHWYGTMGAFDGIRNDARLSALANE